MDEQVTPSREPLDREAEQAPVTTVPAPDALTEGDELTATEEEPRRGGTIRFLVLLLLILIVVILLALRSCGGASTATTASSRQIAPVAGKRPLPGAVSVWIRRGANREAALKGITSSEITDLGNGRLVIEVPIGSEAKAVAMLRRNPGVYDAGFVYQDETPLQPGDVKVEEAP